MAPAMIPLRPCRQTLLCVAAWVLIAGSANSADRTAAQIAQQMTPNPARQSGAWPMTVSEKRAREVETAAALAVLGEKLYRDDADKKDGFGYCMASTRLTDQGQFRLAIREASKALFLGQSQKNPYLVARARMDLANAYLLSGETAAAAEHAKAALADSNQLNSKQRGDIRAPMLKALGDVDLRSARPAEAIRRYLEALDANPGRFTPFVQISLANAYMSTGDLKNAEKVLAHVSDSDNKRIKGLQERAKGNLALARKDHAAAARLFEAAIRNAAGADQLVEKLWAQAGLGDAQLLSGNVPAAIDAYREAMATADTLRGRFASYVFKAGFLGESQRVFDKAIELMIGAGFNDEAFISSERGRARAMLDLMRGRIEASGGTTFARPVNSVTSMEAVRQQLPDRTALIQFHVLPQRTIAWIVRRSGVELVALPETLETLEQGTRELRAAIVSRANADEPAASLFQRLIAPLKLKEGEALIIVPHKALHYLPFHALRSPRGYLIQSHPIAYAPSTSTWLTLASRPQAAVGRVLALGNPTTDTAAEPLTGAEQEVQYIKAAFDKIPVEIFIRDQATKDVVIAKAPGSNVVHIAAHAEIDEIDPLYSRIRLSRGARTRGDMEAHEFFGIDLQSAKLIALSACDSGLGRISRGDEFVGFKQVFFGAGAQGLIVSLWPIEDDSTAKTMQAFYRKFPQTGAMQALRQAQLEMIAQPATSHPMFWAPFTWVGPAN